MTDVWYAVTFLSLLVVGPCGIPPSNASSPRRRSEPGPGWQGRSGLSRFPTMLLAPQCCWRAASGSLRFAAWPGIWLMRSGPVRYCFFTPRSGRPTACRYRRREDAPFLEELWALKNEDPGFTFVPTITGPGIPQPRWRSETGRITLGMMMRHLPAGMPTELARGPVYHLAGPPGMVRGLTEMLHRAGVVDGDIRTEEFSGY